MNISIASKISEILAKERFIKPVSKASNKVYPDRTDFSKIGKDASLVFTQLDSRDGARAERIEEIKRKIEEGSYLTDEVVEKIAENLAKLFLS